MRRTLVLLGVASLWLLATAAPSIGADNGTVNATVSTPAPCMTLDPTTVDFGVLAFSDGATSGGVSPIEVFNCAGAGVSESLSVIGTDAMSTTSAATWTLTGSSLAPCLGGTNRFNAYFSGTATTIDSGGYRSVGAVPGGGSLPLNLGIDMPCIGSDGQGETMAFDISFLVTIP